MLFVCLFVDSWSTTSCATCVTRWWLVYHTDRPCCLFVCWQLEYYKLCYEWDQMTASLSHWSSTLFGDSWSTTSYATSETRWRLVYRTDRPPCLFVCWQLAYYKLCYEWDQMTASLSHWSSTLFVCLLIVEYYKLCYKWDQMTASLSHWSSTLFVCWQLEYYKLCYEWDQMTASLSHWSSSLFVCLLTAGVLQAMLRVWPDDG